MTEETLPSIHLLLGRLTGGIVKSLEKRQGVSNVILEEYSPVERHQLANWEQKNSCLLPEDVKNLYLSTDGLLLKWCVKIDENILPVGRMEINSLSNVVKVAGARPSSDSPSLVDLDYDSDTDMSHVDKGQAHRPPPHFDTRSRLFELDPCRGCGKVCLVYRNTKPGSPAPANNAEYWFLDRSLRWHFLTASFTQYFQLMLVHAGLPQWHYAYTDIGLSPQSQHWFNMFAPLRLAVDDGDEATLSSYTEASTETSIENRLDTNRVFKGKTDKRTKSSSNPKKKCASGNKPSSGTSNNRSSLGNTARFR